MMRKIILPLLALVLVGGAFYLATRGEKNTAPKPIAARHNPSQTPPSSQPMQVIRSGNLPIIGGERPRTRVYDPVTGRIKLELGAESWQPVSEQVYHIVKPDIRVYAPSGQTSYITADESEMEVAQAGRKEIEPRRGRLRGNVQVVVDRTTRLWREQNPARAAREQHPEHLIHISLDEEARFDMELSRLTADGRVTLQSADADLIANPGHEALLLTWNQWDNRAEYLRLQYGGRMEARRGGLVDFSMPGLSGEKRSAAGGTATPVALSDRQALGRMRDALPAAPRVSQLRGPVPSGDQMAQTLRQLAVERPRVPDTQRKKKHGAVSQPASAAASQPAEPPRRADSYAAVFNDNVRIKQTQADKATGGLDCEKLELVFDFGREQKEAADSPFRTPASRPTRTAASKPVNTTQLVIEWSGPLELRSIDVDPAEQSGRRFDAIATGETVHLRDAQGEATCKRMIFRKDPSAVWLTGSETTPARVWSGQQREISATEIMVDRSVGRGQLSGKGFVRDQAASNGTLAGGGLLGSDTARADAGGKNVEPLEIRWSRRAELGLGTTEQRTFNLATRVASTKTRDFLREARFHGDVSIVQGARALNGDEVAVKFGPPRRAGAFAHYITRLDATGDVRMRDADQRIAGRTLRVNMLLTPEGRNVPRQAVCDGEVVVVQPNRSFSAEHLIADFASVPDRASNGQASTRLVMERAQATHRVAVRDEGQHLEADADQLDAHFDAAGRLAKAVLIGPGQNGWAYSHQGDYAINGHHVTLDLAAQHVSVPARGHAVFVTRTDFDGKPLASAAPVNITFSEGMTLDGKENVGVFKGEVHTSTDTHELTCNKRLVVRFFDKGQPGATATPDTTFELTQRKTADDSSLASLSRWTQQRLGITTNDKRASGPRVQKQPAYVVAEGDVAAITTEYDEKNIVRSRMRIAGPTMEVDLRREHMVVPGRGNLTLEDYRPPHLRGAKSAGSEAAPMLGASSGGPSQTAFFWANAMSFDNHEAIATFDRSVQMVHCSGNKLMLKDKLSAAMRADVESLRLGAGRRATLTCENLLVQFVANARNAKDKSSASPVGMQANFNELRRLVATGRVYLVDNTRKLTGESLTLESPSNILTIRGSDGEDATLTDESEETQHVRSWRGPLIRWNRTNGDIEAPGPMVTVR